MKKSTRHRKEKKLAIGAKQEEARVRNQAAKIRSHTIKTAGSLEELENRLKTRSGADAPL
jgi:hypothetical protein